LTYSWEREFPQLFGKEGGTISVQNKNGDAFDLLKTDVQNGRDATASPSFRIIFNREYETKK